MKTANDSKIMGPNRTGIGASPIDSRSMVEGTEEFAPEPGGPEKLADARVDHFREAEPIGTLPPPASLKQVAKSALDALKGKNPNVLMDKLGERLAFERTGCRLYEAVLLKFDAYGSWTGGPTREELEEHLDDERVHLHLVKEHIEQLGGDPTAVTPSADVAAVASSGLLKVVCDPRMNFRESLEALLIAELSDHACWDSLAALADEAGHAEMAEAFRGALSVEAQHLARVKLWVTPRVEAAAEEAQAPAP